MCWVAIYHLAQERLQAGPALLPPAADGAPRGLLAAVTPGKEGFYFSSSLNVIAFIGFGNQFYGLRVCPLKCGMLWRENKMLGWFWP